MPDKLNTLIFLKEQFSEPLDNNKKSRRYVFFCWASYLIHQICMASIMMENMKLMF